MNFKKIQWNKVLPGLVLVFVIAYVSIPDLKIWITRGLMKTGYFNPSVPAITPDANYKLAPDFQLQDINDKVTTTSDLKGKVVFVNFWATWCPPCLVELPSLNTLYEKEKNNPNIVFATVDIDGDLAKSARFMKIKDYHFPVYRQRGADSLFNQGIPTTLVINKKGQIVFTHFNRANYDSDQFLKFIDDLAKQP